MELLARYWWMFVLRGVAGLIFGILALIWPGLTLTALVLLFGAYALVDGIFAIGAAIFGGRSAEGRRPWLVLEGIVGILAGIGTFVWPGITALVLLYVIAAWAVVTGVFEIIAAVQLRREIQGEVLLALAGVFSIIFGILLFVWPVTGALAIVWLIGIYSIVFGVVLIALGIRLRSIRQRGTVVPGSHRPATA
jgi:uncharacterized membrane protein HdeD (DUF308 family)